jgi:hypothetical protein
MIPLKHMLMLHSRFPQLRHKFCVSFLGFKNEELSSFWETEGDRPE